MNLKLLKYNVMVRKIKFRGKDIDTGEWRYGTGNRVKLEESEVSWMTKNSYNGIELKTGNLSDVDQLYLCRFSSSYTKAAIYYFALYNKSLTPEEVEEEKVKLENYWEGGKNELA